MKDKIFGVLGSVFLIRQQVLDGREEYYFTEDFAYFLGDCILNITLDFNAPLIMK
ncbi:hypothetical protein [Neobacillus sp. 19]|uniref:hypothetical protein n=1 Tax=Neobacillus sp. 19 TaxID=3394458 RepID=UPI003BF6236D